MTIRPATIEDLGAIHEAFDCARQFMRETGNATQWTEGYPSDALVRSSIERGCQYVCMDGDLLLGTFYFAVEEDPTYAIIYDGQWLNDRPYGVVHRMASNRNRKGIADFCLQWCYEQCPNIRVDTHRDNLVMQHILRKHGYTPCGTVIVHNGTERLAFQLSAH